MQNVLKKQKISNSLKKQQQSFLYTSCKYSQIMEPFIFLMDFIIHLDEHLGILIQSYGVFVYAILFFIVFLETGLVITPFLPGDSLLFAAGTFAAIGALDLSLLFILLSFAAIGGDTINYWIGNKFGRKVFKGNRFFKKEYLEKAERFYEKHGGKTIFIARFLPIVRTFAPFVAGMGKMQYRRFIIYNVFGGLVWVSLFLSVGFLFGNIPIVKNNFALVIIGIIIASFVPSLIGYILHKFYIKRRN
jgi:membrane-associated protein